MKNANKIIVGILASGVIGITWMTPAHATTTVYTSVANYNFGPFYSSQFTNLTPNGGTVNFFAPNSVTLTGPVSITSSPTTNAGAFSFDYTSVGSGSSYFTLNDVALPAASNPTPVSFSVSPGDSFGFQVFGSGDSLTITNFAASPAPEASSFAALSLSLVGLGVLLIRARRRSTNLT